MDSFSFEKAVKAVLTGSSVNECARHGWLGSYAGLVRSAAEKITGISCHEMKTALFQESKKLGYQCILKSGHKNRHNGTSKTENT